MIDHNQQLEAQLERNFKRHERANDRALDRLDRKFDAADAMIGELASGKCYIYPVGGRYREGTHANLINFLIRNKYV